MSRLKLTTKNIFFGYIANLISILMGFISRTVFINTLGITFLGVNGLFTNVLGVLSFAELGIGTAMNHSLYKPVADNDIKKIKKLMYFYKTAYRLIATIVAVIGLCLLPFLGYIVKDPGNIGNISIYYYVFLFDTVSSYFVSYKFSLLNAEQKNYIFSLINTITLFIKIAVQIIVLLVYKNFLIYLLFGAVIGLLQKIFVNIYLNKEYSYLLDKDKERLTKAELEPIRKNVSALILHKIGEIGVHQTDNIIISAFINVTLVGIVSNYNLLITAVNGFITIVFNSAIASFGNLIATENEKKIYNLFKIYRFAAFWLYGFSSVAYFILLSPFITLWLGESMIISDVTLSLIVINHYMMGHRICINNIKSAGGVFVQDKYVPILQAAVNLILSIILVRLIGLPGVYIGTVVQGTLSTIIKPTIVYKHIFKINPKCYFIDAFKYAVVVLLSIILCWLLKTFFIQDVTIISFLIMIPIVIFIPNILFLLFYKRCDEFIYFKKLLLARMGLK